jgi:hypothetical protein
MGRTKRCFGKLDWTNLLEVAAVGILLAGGFPVRSVGQQQRNTGRAGRISERGGDEHRGELKAVG